MLFVWKLFDMPVYVYRKIKADGSDGEVFECEQSMHDAPLTIHPETGESVQRVYCSPHLTCKYGAGAQKSKLSNEHVEKCGFTKYERDKLTGTYHRVAGCGGPQCL